MNAEVTTTPLQSRPHRPRLFLFARIVVFTGFFILLMASSLAGAEDLGPSLWWLLIALTLVSTGLWCSHRSTPRPLVPINDLSMKYSGWLIVALSAGPFVLRWFNWNGPQIAILVLLAILIGWWASTVPVARKETIHAQYQAAETTAANGD